MFYPQTLTKTEVGTKYWDIVLVSLTMLLFEGLWTLVLWISKAVDYFMCYLLDHTSRSMDDGGNECVLMNYGGLS